MTKAAGTALKIQTTASIATRQKNRYFAPPIFDSAWLLN
jgi:hypothetical protein